MESMMYCSRKVRQCLALVRLTRRRNQPSDRVVAYELLTDTKCAFEIPADEIVTCAYGLRLSLKWVDICLLFGTIGWKRRTLGRWMQIRLLTGITSTNEFDVTLPLQPSSSMMGFFSR